MKRVLVIVVTYNGMRWLERCLGSVQADADLYVFDNDSTDGSADFVEKNYPQAKLIRSAGNLGFSRPNNLGMQYALDKGYDYVYLLNQDAWLEPGALDKLLAVADAHPEYGLLSPLQMTDGYRQLDKQFGMRYTRPYGPRYDKKAVIPSEARESLVVPVCSVMAAHWLVPVPVIRRIGLFNEEIFPHWGQDDDWCNRLHFCGLKIGVVPAARAVHDRAYRKDSLETLLKRNYYTGSLMRLANPCKPLLLQWAFVFLFTLVKTVKYRSLLTFKYFGQICRQTSQIKSARARGMSAR